MVLLVRLMPPGLIVPVLMTLVVTVALVMLRLVSTPALVQPVTVPGPSVVVQAPASA